jgi:SAM-dependent methyltransferase
MNSCQRNKQGRLYDKLSSLAHAQLESAATVVEFGCGGGKLAARLLQDFLPPSCRYLGPPPSSLALSLLFPFLLSLAWFACRDFLPLIPWPLMPLASYPLLVAKQFCIDAFCIVSSAYRIECLIRSLLTLIRSLLTLITHAFWIVSSASAFFHSVLCVQGLLTSLFLLLGYGVCGLHGGGMLSKGCCTTTGVDQSGSMLRSAELRLSAFRDRTLLR